MFILRPGFCIWNIYTSHIDYLYVEYMLFHITQSIQPDERTKVVEIDIVGESSSLEKIACH